MNTKTEIHRNAGGSLESQVVVRNCLVDFGVGENFVEGQRRLRNAAIIDSNSVGTRPEQQHLIQGAVLRPPSTVPAANP